MQIANYPVSHKDAVVENLHGVEVADPYRWLEDPDSAETVDWVESQRVFTNKYLSKIPYRDWFLSTLSKIVSRPVFHTPWAEQGYLLRYVSPGEDGAEQPVLQIGEDLPSLLSQPRVLLDPNSWVEPNCSLDTFTISPNGKLGLYTYSQAGSDWQHIGLVQLVDGQPVEDEKLVTKFCTPVWLPDGKSFVYLAYENSSRVDGTDTGVLSGVKLMIHQVGNSSVGDKVAWDFSSDEQILVDVKSSQSNRGLILTLFKGTGVDTSIWFFPFETADDSGFLGEPIEVLPDFKAPYRPIEIVGNELFVISNDKAPMGEVLAVNLSADSSGEHFSRVVVPEGEHMLDQAKIAGSTLVVAHLVSAQPQLSRWDLTGINLGEMSLGSGDLVEFHTCLDDDRFFVGFSSISDPVSVWEVWASSGVTKQIGTPSAVGTGLKFSYKSATSKDGTEVPYVVISSEDQETFRPRPTLLYGYGGFAIPVLTDFRPGWAAWLKAGGVLVIANLRGGNEFGMDWYLGGIKANKQNVFDDFISVGEALIRDEITTSSQLAIYGRSNGGLLVGACLTQRPDLFAAAIPQVGVLDVVRFHKFTIGAAWVSDYGNPDIAEDFTHLIKYSPLHNIKSGTNYPPTLICTGDHDDRVVPAHSYKFTARLQEAQGDANRPILIRIEESTGHGPGKPRAKVAQEWADMLSFAAYFTGLKPPVDGQPSNTNGSQFQEGSDK